MENGLFTNLYGLCLPNSCLVNNVDYRKLKAEINIHLIDMDMHEDGKLIPYYATLIIDLIRNGLRVSVVYNSASMDIFKAAVNAAQRTMMLALGTYIDIRNLRTIAIAESADDEKLHDIVVEILRMNGTDIAISLDPSCTAHFLRKFEELLKYESNIQIPALIGNCILDVGYTKFVNEMVCDTIYNRNMCEVRPHNIIQYTRRTGGVVATTIGPSFVEEYQWERENKKAMDNFITKEIFNLGIIDMPQ